MAVHGGRLILTIFTLIYQANVKFYQLPIDHKWNRSHPVSHGSNNLEIEEPIPKFSMILRICVPVLPGIAILSEMSMLIHSPN